MAKKKIDELIVEAFDSDSGQLFNEIFNIALHSDKIETQECLSALLEAWGPQTEKSGYKSEFCIKASENNLLDSSSDLVRNSLIKAMKHFLPNDIPLSLAVKITGIKDKTKDLVQVAKAIRKIISISIGNYCYLKTQKITGKISSIDTLTSHLSIIKTGKEFGNLTTVSIEEAMSTLIIFPANEIFSKLISPENIISFSDWKNELNRNSPVNLKEDDIKAIASSVFHKHFPKSANFAKWLSEEKTSAQANLDLKRISDARNLKELSSILNNIKDKPQDISKEEKEQISKLLEKGKNNLSELLLCSSQLASILNNDDIMNYLRPLSCSDLIPSDPSLLPANLIDKLSLDQTNQFAKIFSILTDTEYFAKSFNYLPAKCLTALFEKNDMVQKLTEIISLYDILSPDFWLWIWKNEKKLPESIKNKLSVSNYFSSLTNGEKNNAPGAKELKNLLIRNANFQKSFITLIEKDVQNFLNKLDSSTSFEFEDKQTLLVKLSRNSQSLKNAIKNQKNKSAAKNQNPHENNISRHDQQQRHLVSSKSYHRKVNELKDIINKQIPENTVAIGHARSYGDLRENAEYSAAKERQKYLHRRQHELERDIISAQIIEFKTIKPENTIIIGSTVITQSENNQIDKYHILGAWDSDPKLKHLSYESAFAKILLSKKAGEIIIKNDGSKVKILSVEKLPDEISSELDEIPS